MTPEELNVFEDIYRRIGIENPFQPQVERWADAMEEIWRIRNARSDSNRTEETRRSNPDS